MAVDDIKVHSKNNSAETDQAVEQRVAALYSILSDFWGTDKLVLRASKLETLQEMRSEDVTQRILALVKLVNNDATLGDTPASSDYLGLLEGVEEKIALQMARRNVEDQLEDKIAQHMYQRQEEYLKEIKMQIIKDKTGPENAQTLKKLAKLEKMEHTGLTKSIQEMLRPSNLEEVIGQQRSVRSLISKLATPFPQHVIIYGPPGVGKTSAARLALEKAKKITGTPFGGDAPFIEVDGSTLRWDPRDTTNPLLGSVHDPIYQGAKRDLADTGVPEPKLGLVSHSHGGVLFIDEILEMDPVMLNKLLKVLEDKRVEFESSYYDAEDENVPQYVKKLFEEGAPADFVLIGATTRSPSELHPALRSRCAEVFFDPLTPEDVRQIVTNAAEKLAVEMEPSVAGIISEYTVEGRKANNILADAYGLALYRQQELGGNENISVSTHLVYEVIQNARLTPFNVIKTNSGGAVGRVFGLGVSGFVGSVIEIECVAFTAAVAGKGKVRFNDTAGSMAKDSVFNAISVIRKLTGKDIADYDVHINVIGGGNIDGPSAGVAIFLALLSALEQKDIRQDIGVTGELSIQGTVKPVGGIPEKIYGARQSGIKTIFIPQENKQDIPVGLKGVKIITIDHINEIIEHVIM